MVRCDTDDSDREGEEIRRKEKVVAAKRGRLPVSVWLGFC